MDILILALFTYILAEVLIAICKFLIRVLNKIFGADNDDDDGEDGDDNNSSVYKFY